MAALFLAFAAGPLVMDAERSSHLGLRIPSVCLFKALTGCNCPACGITRSVAQVYQLDFHGAIARHPAGPLVAAMVILLFFYFSVSVVFPTRRFLSWRAEIAMMRAASVVVVAALLLSWPVTINAIQGG